MCPFVYICEWICTCMQCLRRLEEGVRSLGAEVTGVCEPSVICAGIQTPVLMAEQQVFLATSHLQPQIPVH